MKGKNENGRQCSEKSDKRAESIQATKREMPREGEGGVRAIRKCYAGVWAQRRMREKNWALDRRA